MATSWRASNWYEPPEHTGAGGPGPPRPIPLFTSRRGLGASRVIWHFPATKCYVSRGSKAAAQTTGGGERSRRREKTAESRGTWLVVLSVTAVRLEALELVC